MPHPIAAMLQRDQYSAGNTAAAAAAAVKSRVAQLVVFSAP